MSVQALSCAMIVRGVTASEKLLLLVLSNYADEHMSCWPSHRRMATDTCLTERTILTLLKGLEAKRIISRRERVRADGSRTTDAITLHFSGEVISPPGETGDTGVGKSTTPGGAVISPLTTFEPSLEPMEADASIFIDATFAEFWSAYPNKVGKRDARGSYDRALKRISGPDPPSVILAGVARAQTSRKWLDGIIPNPATWLNQDRWEDEPSENHSPRKAHERPHPDAKFEARQANLATHERGADLAARLHDSG